MTLRDVTPLAAVDDIRYLLAGDTARTSDRVHAGASRSPGANRAHAVLCQFRQALPLASGATVRVCMLAVAIARRLSALMAHIGAVVRGRSGEQMGRIHARRGIAAVQHKQAIWNTAVCQFVGHAMGAAWATILSEGSVTVLASTASPQPTLIIGSALNLAPETIGGGGVHRTILPQRIENYG